MPLMPLNRALTDLGGVPVLWDSDTGTLVQDPTQGGTNSYGPGDVFRDPNTGDLYQLEQDGSLSLYRVGTPPPSVSAPAGGAPVAGQIVGNTVSSAGRSFTDAPVASGGPAITATGNPTQFGHQVVAWLSKASFIGGMPNGVLVMMGAVAYMFVKQRRRRNPWYVRRQRTRDRSQRFEMFGESQVGRQSYSRTYPTQRAAEREAAAWRSTGDWSADVLEGRAPRKRNPRSTPVRVVHNRLLGGWYVVMGPQQTPISGRFGSKEQAHAWVRQRRRDLGPGRDTNRYGYYAYSNPGRRRRGERREARHRSREAYRGEQARVEAERYFAPYRSVPTLARRRRFGRAGYFGR